MQVILWGISLAGFEVLRAWEYCYWARSAYSAKYLIEDGT
jgi:hypothetical protein